MPPIHSPYGAVLHPDEVRNYCAELKRQADQLGVGEADLVAIADAAATDVAINRISCAVLGCAFASESISFDCATLSLSCVWTSGSPRPVLKRTNTVGSARLSSLVADHGERLAYLMATSGSTGASRRAVISASAVRRVFESLVAELDSAVPIGVPWIGFHAPSFGFSLFELFGCVSFQGELWLVDPPRQGNFTSAINAIRSSNRRCVLSLTPSELSLFLTEIAELDAVLPECIVLSGEPASRAGLDRLFERADIEDTIVINTYAAVETAGQITASIVDRESYSTVARGRVGTPLPGVVVRTSAEDGSGPGEILVSGQTLALGYLEPEATNARFSRGTDRQFRTGDSGYIREDGQLVVTGRVADNQKIGGRWVDLGHLERTLNDHPAVIDVALCALPADPSETSRDFLGVLLVPGRSDAPRLIRRLLVDELAVDQTIRIRTVSRIPAREGGKRNLRDIRAKLIATSKQMPVTSGEILQLWRDLLGEGVDIDRNLFECGVDSLGVNYAASRLGALIGRRVSPAELLGYPTVRLQARRLGAVDGRVEEAPCEQRATRREAWRERVAVRRRRSGMSEEEAKG